LGSRGRWISEFEASLVYKVSSTTAKATQRNPVWEKKKKERKKRKEKKRKEKKRKEKKRKEKKKDCPLLQFGSLVTIPLDFFSKPIKNIFGMDIYALCIPVC
jgi:hypothetical protein